MAGKGFAAPPRERHFLQQATGWPAPRGGRTLSPFRAALAPLPLCLPSLPRP